MGYEPRHPCFCYPVLKIVTHDRINRSVDRYTHDPTENITGRQQAESAPRIKPFGLILAIMAELVTFGETPLRFSPLENERLEMARETRVYADGTSSNVAIAANELGADALWLSKLVDTPLGRSVVSQVQEQGVDVEITWSDGADQRQGLLFHEAGQYPREQQYWHDRSNTAMSTAEPGDFPMNRIRDAEILFTDLGTAVQSQTSAETTQALLRAGAGGGATTALDLTYAPGLASRETFLGLFEQLAGEVDVLFANESDVRTVFDRGGNARELANVLAADYDLEISVITRAQHGAVTLHNSPGTNVIHERKTIDADAIDSTGQRSAFVGAFLEELIQGSDAARALSVAVATAALTRTIRGPYLTTVGDELEPLVEEVVERSQ